MLGVVGAHCTEVYLVLGVADGVALGDLVWLVTQLGVAGSILGVAGGALLCSSN